MADFVDPDRARFGEFKRLPRDHPVAMLNLVRLNEEARYEDGSVTSGFDAYAAYGRESGRVFARLGGRILWSGSFELTLIGPRDERWDHVFIAGYPSGQAFIDMLCDPDYRRAVRHRQAAVKTSRLIRLKPKPTGDVFG